MSGILPPPHLLYYWETEILLQQAEEERSLASSASDGGQELPTTSTTTLNLREFKSSFTRGTRTKRVVKNLTYISDVECSTYIVLM